MTKADIIIFLDSFLLTMNLAIAFIAAYKAFKEKLQVGHDNVTVIIVVLWIFWLAYAVIVDLALYSTGSFDYLKPHMNDFIYRKLLLILLNGLYGLQVFEYKFSWLRGKK